MVLLQIKSSYGLLPHPSSPPHPPFPSSHLTSFQRDSLPLPSSSQPPPTPPSSGNRISPAVLFIIVILAVIFFISGLLHLLVRFLIKKGPSSSSSHSNRQNTGGEISSSDALQRQLQQLFHLHDSGLDQAFIDALPVFLYREIVGSKEPFDCAVCLCEFSEEDQLRLLPVCGHAFHLNCIDTWLLSNSTCPLCRGALFIQGLAIENPIFDFDDSRDEEERVSAGNEAGEIGSEKRVLPVRLGKFRSVSKRHDGNEATEIVVASSNLRREEGESSSSNLDARRCYSMGSYQYVVGDANLRVELCSGSRNGDGKGMRKRELLGGNSSAEEGVEGKKLYAGSKGESFSVSKIWLWSNKKGKFPVSSADDSSSLEGGLPWMARSVGDS